VADDEHLGDELAADALSLVVPRSGTLARRMFGAVRREWQRNLSRALGAAEQAAGLTREEIADWLHADPAAAPLYVQVLWAAGSNGHDKTLRAMGAVFGFAAKASARGEESAVEDAELALRALAGFSPRHFRVLNVLAAGGVARGEDGRENIGLVTPAHVAEQTGLRLEIASQCLLNLAGAGLTTTVNSFLGGNTGYPISELGRAGHSRGRGGVRGPFTGLRNAHIGTSVRPSVRCALPVACGAVRPVASSAAAPPTGVLRR
jgi:hypothetical protein